MRYWGIYIFLILCLTGLNAQECPELLNPVNGAANVPVDTSISWEQVVGINGFILSIGTSPGGGEIINEQSVGSDTTFQPPLGLPESTQIYVTITLFFFDQPNIVCSSKSFTTRDETTVPECTSLITPVNGEEGVNRGVILNWAYAGRALGYRLTIGTAPGAGDIINNIDVGNVLFFDPPDDFPPETEIFVLIAPYNENGTATNCNEESFTTAEMGEPPGCTMLISPMNGDFNVELSPIIEWEAVPEAIGYFVTIGSSPFNADVLDDAVFFDNRISVLNFEPNTTYFITISPFNDAGRAQGCEQESFSTILGCGPFYDDETGELFFLSPEIDFPGEVAICEDNIPTRITAEDAADGYRWYRILDSGEEVLLSEESYADLSEPGQYRYEAYNVITQGEFEIECSADRQFVARLSGKAIIDRIVVDQVGRFFDVTAEVSGQGDYEFALNNINGPYNDNNIFTMLPRGDYVLYVRDKSGCGIEEKEFRLAFPPPGFPAYFSPNGDGINDYWQYIPPVANPLKLREIYIYDRYGKILANFSPNAQGWDGTYNGAMMPADGYWYRALSEEGEVFSGYFSLVR